MLKPRLANRPAIRVRTPDLFSTRIESTCLRPVRMFVDASSSSRLRGSLVPGSPMTVTSNRRPAGSSDWNDRPPGARLVMGMQTFPSPDHLARGRAGWDHRVGVLLARDAHVDEHRTVGGDRALDVVDERVLVGEAHAGDAVGLGELDEVGELSHVDVAVFAVPEQLLPLADHAEIAVV